MELKRPAAHEIVDSIEQAIEASCANGESDEHGPEPIWGAVTARAVGSFSSLGGDRWAGMTAFRNSGAVRNPAMRGL